MHWLKLSGWEECSWRNWGAVPQRLHIRRWLVKLCFSNQLCSKRGKKIINRICTQFRRFYTPHFIMFFFSVWVLWCWKCKWELRKRRKRNISQIHPGKVTGTCFFSCFARILENIMSPIATVWKCIGRSSSLSTNLLRTEGKRKE